MLGQEDHTLRLGIIVLGRGRNRGCLATGGTLVQAVTRKRRLSQ
jgi:hypothetical protein